MADIESLPFHRKYRPTSVARYIGNEKVKETVFQVLRSGQRPQVILFYGDSGCGKTSLARLLCKEYCCDDWSPDTGSCGVCSHCEALTEYIATGNTDNLINVTEINVADSSRKDDLTSVLEDMQIPAWDNEWKIYIFDECHKASGALQDRMLKIMEEPPEHVLMMFCTTRPQDLVPTLVNRCQLKLHVQKPSLKELTMLMRSICSAEQVDYDTAGLEFIANRADLCIRDALQDLWLVVNAHSSAKYDDVAKTFEAVSSGILINFFRTLKRKDIMSFVSLISDIKGKMDLQAFIKELANFVKRGVYVINGVKIDGVADKELLVYREIFGDLGVYGVGAILNRILRLNQDNLELELLMWGYDGLVSEPSRTVESFDIKSVENELEQEQKNINTRLDEEKEELFTQGIKNADTLMSSVDLSMLMSLGATVVDN